MSTKGFVKATSFLALICIVSKFSGFIREAILAQTYGAGSTSDAYFAAVTIPNLVVAIVGGALYVVVVPMFSRLLVKEGKEEAWQFFNQLINLVFLGLIVISALSMGISHWLVRVVTPGFNLETALLTGKIMLILLPTLVFLSISMVFTGLLNVNQVFGIPAFAPVVNNLVVILYLLFGGRNYGIEGLGVVALAGSLITLLVQLPALKKVGYRFRFNLNFRHKYFREIICLAVPVLIGNSFNQVYLVIERVLASGLAPGSISALNFADKIIQLPLGIFAASVGSVLFPALTDQIAQGKSQLMRQTMLKWIKRLILLLLPVSTVLIVLRKEIVYFFFQQGVFTAEDTERTSLALMFYAIGLTGRSLNTILNFSFYALKNMSQTVKAYSVAALVNLSLSIVLIPFLSHGGLALASSMGVMVNCGLLLFYLDKRFAGFLTKDLWVLLSKCILSSSVMALVILLLKEHLVVYLHNYGRIGLALQAGVSVTVGMMIYFAVLYLLKTREITLSRGKKLDS